MMFLPAALKTPPAFHEQRQKLERAKTGDLLKAKIQQRPDRQELVRQHILEGECSVDSDACRIAVVDDQIVMRFICHTL